MNSTQEQSTTQQKENPKLWRYTNRWGDSYFLHSKVTKNGKTSYFMAKNRAQGALSTIPPGYEVTENVNGMVFIGKPRAQLIPDIDVRLMKTKLAKFKHLKKHQVQAKYDQLVIFSPIDAGIAEQMQVDNFSYLNSLRRTFETMGKGKFEGIVEEAASKMGVTTKQFREMERKLAKERRDEVVRQLEMRIQYEPVLRFTKQKGRYLYTAERRYYRGEEEWLFLGEGTLETLSNKFIKHIGKESFFDLV